MWSFFKNLFQRQNYKLPYYTSAVLREFIPGFYFRNKLKEKLSSIKGSEREAIQQRVSYYNKLNTNQTLTDAAVALTDIKLPKKKRVYYFDTNEYTRYFKPLLKANFLFGDIIHIPDEPSIVKSRPIHGDNAFSVLLKLNKVRHFSFIHDSIEFKSKKNILIGRSAVHQQHRMKFYEMYFNHPLCDLGQTNTDKNPQWIKPKMSLREHLNFKFILCLEGNDVATNLKWVMSSNSLAVMPVPKYETWFMEGKLIPDFHYVQIREDYADLEEKLNYYIKNTDAALQILKNAHDHVRQFKNKKREDLISLLVLEKYFYRTGQLPAQNS